MKAGGGSRIRNVRFATEGTLCCLVHRPSEPGSIFLLSAAHVLARNGLAVKGDSILWLHDGTETEIASYDSFVRFRPDRAGQVCDAAIARVSQPDLVTADIDGIGAPRGRAAPLYSGQPLQLSGSTSGRLTGLGLYRHEQNVPVVYESSTGGTYRVQFDRQILYGRLGSGVQAVTSGGDSGAAVVDRDRNVLGLHVAVTPHDYPVRASVCTPIDLILEALGVELITERLWGRVTAQGAASAASALAEIATDLPIPRQLARDRASELGLELFDIAMGGLLDPHRFADSVVWQLSEDGLIVDGQLPFSGGRLVTVPRVWRKFGGPILEICAEMRVPVELAIATACTESSGDELAERREPGWISNEETPHRVSIGLMQTLIATARIALKDPSLTGQDLLEPETSLRAGLAYIRNHRKETLYDPPKVAAAYNAGRLRLNDAPGNRWKMRQFPIGTGAHVDRFVMWFNDCFRFFDAMEPAAVPKNSFYGLLRGLT